MLILIVITLSMFTYGLTNDVTGKVLYKTVMKSPKKCVIILQRWNLVSVPYYCADSMKSTA